MLLNPDPSLRRTVTAKAAHQWWSPLAVATMKAIRVVAAARPIAAILWGVPAHGMRKYLAPEAEVFASGYPSPMSV